MQRENFDSEIHLSTWFLEMPTLPSPIFFLHWFLSRTKQAYYAQGSMIHHISINKDWTYPRGVFWPITSLKYRLFCVARHEWFSYGNFTNRAELCRCCIEYPPSIICRSKTGASIFDLSLLILQRCMQRSLLEIARWLRMQSSVSENF